MRSQDGLDECRSLPGIAPAKPRDGSIDLQVGVRGSEFQRFAKEASGFFEPILRKRKICHLPQTQGDGLTVVAFRLNQVAGRKRYFSCVELPTQGLSGVVSCPSEGGKKHGQRDTKNDDSEAATQRSAERQGLLIG